MALADFWERDSSMCFHVLYKALSGSVWWIHGRVEIFKSLRVGLFNSPGKKCHGTDWEGHAGVTHQDGVHERRISVIMWIRSLEKGHVEFKSTIGISGEDAIKYWRYGVRN